MDRLNKAILLPFVSSLLLTLKDLFHIQFDANTANAIVDLILAIIGIVGIFMHPKTVQPPVTQTVLLPVQQQQPQEQSHS